MLPGEVSYTNTTTSISDSYYVNRTSQNSNIKSFSKNYSDNRDYSLVLSTPIYDKIIEPKIAESKEKIDETCKEVGSDGNDDWTHVVYCVEDWEFGGLSHTPVNR